MTDPDVTPELHAGRGFRSWTRGTPVDDQFDYVRAWAGTAIQRGVDAAIHAGVPVGGISAGLAVLGGFAFTAERDTITSAEALADPFDDRVRLARGFLTVPALEATIT